MRTVRTGSGISDTEVVFARFDNIGPPMPRYVENLCANSTTEAYCGGIGSPDGYGFVTFFGCTTAFLLGAFGGFGGG